MRAIVTRRTALKTATATLAFLGLKPTALAGDSQAPRVVRNGRLRQSVSRWPYRSIPLSDFCRAVADMGLTAIDLLDEPDWPIVRQYGLVCSMGYAGGGSIPEHIAHFHTGGVPGRNELDDRQELNWPAICRAIVDIGFPGYVAHEFRPTRDPIMSLREAVIVCDV
jgi:hypothetical protein